MDIITFDLETTGLGEDARIVEFSFIRLDKDLNEVSRLSSLVNPGVPIPAEVTKIHGIRDEDVAKAPSFRGFAATVQRMLAGNALCAHNAEFDCRMLDAELVRAGQPGIPDDQFIIDTLENERLVLSHTLGATYQRYTGQPHAGWHRAEDDASAAVAVLRGQLERHGATLGSIGDLDWKSVRIRQDPRRADRQPVDMAGKFYRDAAGAVRFAFGMHKDQPIEERRDYLVWMLNGTFSPSTKRFVRNYLERTRQEKQAAISVAPEAAAVEA